MNEINKYKTEILDLRINENSEGLLDLLDAIESIIDEVQKDVIEILEDIDNGLPMDYNLNQAYQELADYKELGSLALKAINEIEQIHKKAQSYGYKGTF